MQPFLKSVARAYAGRFPDLSGFLFLFPNKRSGAFFLKHLHEALPEGKVMLAPEVLTITDFVERLSGRVIGSRVDSLFRLYECYCRVVSGTENFDRANPPVDFDGFRGWGETVLKDFDEVDLYGVDPHGIFKNVRDFREISSNFLTPEQRKIMEEYFGFVPHEESVRDFWREFGGTDRDDDSKEESLIRRKFRYLWSVLSPLYDSFNESMAASGLVTPGGAYRLALANLEGGRAGLPWTKIVAVGFNALSLTEASIFSFLKRTESPLYRGEPFADFLWDGTGPVLGRGSVDSTASRFLKANLKEFPMPEWIEPCLEESATDSMPEKIRVVAAPSDSIQAKIAGEILGELRGILTDEEFHEARVAGVLPDENLLLPLLYALPEDAGDVNLTMGYPLRLTSVVSFVSLLRKLSARARRQGDDDVFYHQDLRLILAHPFTKILLGSEACSAIVERLDTRHLHTVTLSLLKEFSPKASMVFRRFSPDDTPSRILAFVDNLLAEVSEAMETGGDILVKSRLDREHIAVYRDALRRLAEAVEDYGLKMRPDTVMGIVDRLLAGERVSFEGEPLRGLQVMGLLETRSLDFDYLVIPSMNESVFPMRSRKPSFIPDSLRRGFGMPPSNYEESLFAYYFYRLISRAKRVVLLYDSRAEGGVGGGGVSRYILQLRHLFAPGYLSEEEYHFRISSLGVKDADVEKTPAVMAQVEKYAEEGSGKNLSASALGNFFSCQVKFYYNNVMNISDAPEPDSSIDPITHGNIVHAVLQNLYLPHDLQKRFLTSPVRVTREKLESILADRERVMKLLTREVNLRHFQLDDSALDTPLAGAAAMVAGRMAAQIISVLEHDLDLVPFDLYGCEISDTLRLPAAGRTVNMKFAIDRLDCVATEEGPRMRIVDYKTGSVHLQAGDFADIFSEDYRCSNIFQLLLYSWLLNRFPLPPGFMLPGEKVNGKGEREIPVIMEIYDLSKAGTLSVGVPKIDGMTRSEYLPMAEMFDEGLDNVIKDIFSPGAFRATDNTDTCRLCAMRSVCGR